MAKPTARLATPNDARFLVTMESSFGTEAPKKWDEILAKQGGDTATLVAQEGGLYAGFMLVKQEASVVFPTEVFVSPLCKEDGIEQALGEKAAALCVRQGLSWAPTAPEAFPSAAALPLLV
jgi:hypothetical protein